MVVSVCFESSKRRTCYLAFADSFPATITTISTESERREIVTLHQTTGWLGIFIANPGEI